jgi:UDP-GlcNAc:undecaprenyl-phosphate GlcNAc-1-phosphate transferase
VNGAWYQYLAILAGTAILSLLLTPLAIRFATRRRIMDNPGGHKSHTNPVPYLGGLAIVTAFSLMILAVAAFDISSVGGELAAALGVALALALIGLVDDLRGLPALLRLVAEIGAGVLLVQMGLGVTFTGSDLLDAAVTVVWVVGITNAWNLLDNMDGLSAGLAAIASFSIFTVAAANGQYLVGGLAIAVAGCALGFLRHNFHPARIYMGDAGALFFGFMIAYLGLKLSLSAPPSPSFLVPVLICSVAVLDTTLVTIVRLANGRSPLKGGRDHISHRLVRIGLPVPVAVGVIYAVAATMGVIALVASRVDMGSAWILAGLATTLLTTFGVLLASVPVYEGSKRLLYTLRPVEPAPVPVNAGG